VGALVVGSNLEGAARAGGGFLEDKGDRLAIEMRLLDAGFLGVFQFRRQLQQVAYFFGSEVQELEEMSVAKVDSHGSPLVWQQKMDKDHLVLETALIGSIFSNYQKLLLVSNDCRIKSTRRSRQEGTWGQGVSSSSSSVHLVV
jgi:hypothetical protein